MSCKAGRHGDHSTLANKWQEVLISQAFTLCLQYRYASGRNTADPHWRWTRSKPCSISAPTPSA